MKVITINRNPGDFVRDTRFLSVEDRGAYQEILDQIVITGQDENPPSIPDDDRETALMLGWSVGRWKKTKERLCDGTRAVLVIANGRLTQARIVEEIEAARDRIVKAQGAGVASGESRRKKAALVERMLNASSTQVQPRANPEATRTPTQGEPVMSHESLESESLAHSRSGNGSSGSVTRSDTQATRDAKKEREVAFQIRWAAYPRKQGRDDALRHFLRQFKTPADDAKLDDALRNYRDEIDILMTGDEFIMHGSKFFNSRWKDYQSGVWKKPRRPGAPDPMRTVV